MNYIQLPEKGYCTWSVVYINDIFSYSRHYAYGKVYVGLKTFPMYRYILGLQDGYIHVAEAEMT